MLRPTGGLEEQLQGDLVRPGALDEASFGIGWGLHKCYFEKYIINKRQLPNFTVWLAKVSNNSQNLEHTKKQFFLGKSSKLLSQGFPFSGELCRRDCPQHLQPLLSNITHISNLQSNSKGYSTAQIFNPQGKHVDYSWMSLLSAGMHIETVGLLISGSPKT